MREKRRVWVLEPCQRGLGDEEREGIGKDIHGDAKKHMSVEAEDQGHVIVAICPGEEPQAENRWRGVVESRVCQAL